MRIRKSLRSILICLIAFTLLTGTISLTGCGSSDGGSDSTTEDTNDSDTSSSASISGQVADGYLSNAKVCLDTNQNKRCDEGEPYAFSDGEKGEYNIKNVTSAQKEKYSVVVEVTTQTVDQDTKEPVSKGYTMEGLPGDHDFISPMSTMIKHQMDENPASDAESAQTKIKNIMGILDNTDLTEDYIENKSETVHNVSRAVTIAMGEIESLLNELGINLQNKNKAAIQATIMDAVSQNLDKVANAIKSEKDHINAATEVTNNAIFDKNTAENIIQEKEQELDQKKNAIYTTDVKKLLENKITGNLDVYSDNNDNLLVGVYLDKRIDGVGYYRKFDDLASIPPLLDNIEFEKDQYKAENYTIDDDGSFIVNAGTQKAIIKSIAATSLQGETLKLKDFVDDHDLDKESNLANKYVTFSEGAKFCEWSVVQERPDDFSKLSTDNFHTLYDNQIDLDSFTLEEFVNHANTNNENTFSWLGENYQFTSSNSIVKEGTNIKAGSYEILNVDGTKTLFAKLPQAKWDMAVRIGQDERQQTRLLSSDVILTKRVETFPNLNKQALQDVLDTLIVAGY